MTKKQYNILFKWATNEIKAYQEFIKEIKKLYETRKR